MRGKTSTSATKRQVNKAHLETNSGWWLSLPLWKMMEFVSWDDDIPNMAGKYKCSKPPTRILLLMGINKRLHIGYRCLGSGWIPTPASPNKTASLKKHVHTKWSNKIITPADGINTTTCSSFHGWNSCLRQLPRSSPKRHQQKLTTAPIRCWVFPTNLSSSIATMSWENMLVSLPEWPQLKNTVFLQCIHDEKLTPWKMKT